MSNRDLRSVYFPYAEPNVDFWQLQPFGSRPRRCPKCGNRKHGLSRVLGFGLENTWAGPRFKQGPYSCFCTAHSDSPHLEFYCTSCQFDFGTETSQ